MHFSFSAVDENVDENEIHFRPKKKRKRRSPMDISQNLVTVQLQTEHFRPNAK